MLLRREQGGIAAVDPRREEAELRSYLGARYDHSRLERYEEQLDEEYEAMNDEQAFYRSSEAYLYNLTAFAMTGTKLPYLRDLTEVIPRGARLLDYGSGIGSDGLTLIDAGYRVAFADFDNPSSRYLRWRLAQRGLEADVYDLDRESPPSAFDLAYAFDVIEHVDDPFAFLGRLERCATHVLVNFLETGPDEQGAHRELPVLALLDHARNRTLLRYRCYHGRSHLVLYGRKPSAGLSGALSRGRLAGGRLRARAASLRRRIGTVGS